MNACFALTFDRAENVILSAFPQHIFINVFSVCIIFPEMHAHIHNTNTEHMQKGIYWWNNSCLFFFCDTSFYIIKCWVAVFSHDGWVDGWERSVIFLKYIAPHVWRICLCAKHRMEILILNFRWIVLCYTIHFFIIYIYTYTYIFILLFHLILFIRKIIIR